MARFPTGLAMGLAALVAIMSPPAFAQRPGALIAAEPVADAPPAMQAWRIRYWTSDENSRPIAVSGMVIAPVRRAGDRERPVIA